MTSTKIWMPLYIADYLADTTRLTTEQHGAYLLLIMDYWRNGPLPDDDHALSNITRLAPPAWKKHRAALSRMFQIEGCEWRHKRIDEELAEAKSNAEKYAERAKKAAAKRWGKDAASNATGNASSIPQAMPDECTSPSPTPVNSEANASGGKPPREMTKDELWKAGKSILAQAGMPAAQCGSFVGGLVKDYGDAVVMDAVRAAVVERPADPASYIKAVCMHAAGQRGRTQSIQKAKHENFSIVEAA